MQPKMFVVKKSSGLIYNFYISRIGGICYKIYSLHNNQKVDPFEISVTDEKVFELSVDIDEEDNIHILCLTDEGDLKYFVNKENIWDNKVISHFDLRSNIIKSLFIHIVNKKAYVMYAASNLMNTNLWTVYFKAWNGTKWSSMNIGITISDKEFLPYYAVVDNQNNIHVIYKSSSSKGSQMFYRKFHEQFSLWSSPEKVVNSPEFIGYYYIFCGTNGIVHLIWSTATGTNFKLSYKRMSTKVLNNKLHDRVVTLSTSNYPYLQPVILEIDKRIWIIWKEHGTFYGCEVEQSGLSSSSTTQIQSSDSTTAVLVEFISNYEIEKQSFNGHLLYGVLGEFIDLVIPQNYSCDLYQGIADDPVDREVEELPTENFTPENKMHQVAVRQNQDKAVKPVVIEQQISGALSSEFNQLKSDNEKIVRLLEEVKIQLESHTVVNVLEEIKTQNEVVMQAILDILKNGEQYQKNSEKHKGGFKGIMGLFRD